MRFGMTMISEVVLAFIFGIWTQDFFLATVLTVLGAFIVYNLWDEFFNYIQEEK